MEAKDTVMPEEGRIILSYMNPEIIEAAIAALLNKQAEITAPIFFEEGYKAGQEGRQNEFNLLLSMLDKEIAITDLKTLPEAGGEFARAQFKAGIREVVDWIKSNNWLLEPPRGDSHFRSSWAFDIENWQTQLKNWGIDKEVKDDKEIMS